MKNISPTEDALFSRWREEWTREIARPMEESRHELDVHLFVFRTGLEWYGIHPSCIAAVIPSPVIHRLPGRQGAVAGLINFRGKIIPYIALSESLKTGTLTGQLAHAGIFNFHGWFLAFPMTQTEGIRRFSSADILKPPSTIGESLLTHVTGIFDWDRKSVIWLDAEKLGQTLRKEVR